jgi:uncharacterized protein involved in exopolysaccharide biosynthesis
MLTKAQAERAAKVIADAAVKAGITLDAKDIDPEELQTQLRLDNPEKTDLITIGFEGSTPEKAALLANGYAQAFIKWKKGIIHSNAKAYAMSLKDRLDQAKTEMKTAQSKLQSFQQANDVSDVDEDTKSLTAMYAKRESDQGDLDRDAEAAQAELNRLGALMRSESRKLKQQGWIRDDNLILKLQQQLADAEVERDHARLKYRDSFPGGLGPLDDKVTNLKGKIRTMVDESVGAEVPTLSSQAGLVDQYRKRLVDTTYALARQNANKRVLIHMKTKLDKLPQLKKNYANYTREADGIAARVALLQSKYTSALADMLNAHNDVQQVGIATPPTKPSKPRATVNLALGLIAGAFLSVLATILAESRNPSINNVSDLREA